MDSENVTKFYIDSNNLGKWIHQNNAEYTGAFYEGCLLDNFVLVTDKGFAAVYEHYVNAWTSNYYVEYQKGATQKVWRNWYDFEKKYIAEYGEQE